MGFFVMRVFLSSLIICISFLFSAAPAFQPASTQANNTELQKRVSNLIEQMTLEEKVGQMTQIAIKVVADTMQPHGGWQALDANNLQQAIVDYHVGSILNVHNSAYTLGNWHDIINQIQDIATKQTRLQIPIIYGIDAIHGANYTTGATLFPQSISMAATWNPELLKKSAKITAYETRASGIPWNFNPVLGAGRQPVWSRLWETFGEDAFLASAMGYAYVKGLEGENNTIGDKDKVAACIKHYLGYSFPLTGKDRTPAYIPERMLREHFLPIFKAGVDAGAHSLMVNSSEINGVPVHGSHYYLTELLRNELGFEGFIVSDWEDIIRLHKRQKVAVTPKEAVRQAVMAGVDMSMVPFDYTFYTYLVALVKEGAVPESRIDDAVGRILTAKFKLGLFENPYPDTTLVAGFASEDFQKTALKAARESITLLKNNDNLLPLKQQSKVFVTGPAANKLTCLNGGWT
ncbi:MAG: glycoside hydrolase family 3 protein, partial [Calditrichaeota bacterium]